MKKIYLCIIFSLPILAFAQSPCNDTQVTLSSQAEVDSFPSQFCSSLCALTIQGNDITNLDSLYVLQSVGELRITFNPVLSDLHGLSNLTTIGTNCFRSGLTIEMNNVIPNLDGLSSLTSITGTFYLNDNTMLSDVNGLSSLTDIDGLEINSNGSLQNLDGFAGLSYLNSLTISNNPGLTDLDGLSHVTQVGGSVSISYNDGLASLNGLAGVTRIQEFLSIRYNADLESLQGLSNINHIGQFSASGMSLEVSYNDALTSLNGLQGLDSIPGTATIEGNELLQDLDGLSSLRTLDAPIGNSYNTGIRIAGNHSLTDISGIAAVETIGDGRAAWFEIISNDALTTIDSLSLKEITGSLGSRLVINGNENLADVDGLSSLERVSGGLSAIVQIDSNPSLQNLDGLSNLANISSSRGGTLQITGNTELGSFCGLYTLIHAKGIGCGSPDCYSEAGITISGNERNPTPEQIESEGPCGATTGQPTNIVFSQVTSEGMRVRFNRAASFASGYLVLMKSHGPSAPEDVPQDGNTYHVGQVLGSSSIVVSVGTDTTFVVSGLIPSTPYYFDVFSYRITENGNDYVTANPLEGSQSTTGQGTFESHLTFTDVTDGSITVITEGEPGNYIALMKAFGYPSPNDVPVDGTEYHVGGTVGSSTIVVNIGDGSAFTVNGLMPDVTYYFDVYRYDPSTLTYEAGPAQGSQATNESGENLRAYPNPFDVTTTIPFVVSQGDAMVQVAIYDAMGREVSVLAAGSFAAGRHEASWDGYDKFGRRVTAGVYIFSVKSEEGVMTGRVSVR